METTVLQALLEQGGMITILLCVLYGVRVMITRQQTTQTRLQEKQIDAYHLESEKNRAQRQNTIDKLFIRHDTHANTLNAQNKILDDHSRHLVDIKQEIKELQSKK